LGQDMRRECARVACPYISEGVIEMKVNREKKSRISGESEGALVIFRKKGLSSILGSVRLKRIISALMCFILAATVTGTQVLPGVYPLGIALTASATGITNTVSTLVGVIVGSVRIRGVGGIYAMSAAILAALRLGSSVWLQSGNNDEILDRRKRGRFFSRMKKLIGQSPTIHNVVNALGIETGLYSGIMLRENYRIRMALSACAALISGAWSVVWGGYVYYDLIGAVFSLIITPVITYLFYSARDGNMSRAYMREIGVYSVFAFVALSLHQISGGDILPGVKFDLGVLFAFAIGCFVSFEHGIYRGVLTGLLCGMVMDPVYAPAYAVSAIISAALWKYSEIFAVIVAGIGATAWGIYIDGFSGFSAIFPPIVLAVATVIPLHRYKLIKLPDDLFGGGSLLHKAAVSESVAALTAGDMQRRIDDLSEGLGSVSAVLGGMAERLSKPSPGEMREIVEESFGTYCYECHNREKCGYGEKNSKITGVIPKMTEELSEKGVVSAATIPSSLASACHNMGKILDEINLTSGKRIAAMREGDKLSVSAVDFGLAGELFRRAGQANRGIGAIDEELSKKLGRILSVNNFAASTVTAYGSRLKHIFVGDVDLSLTRMGGDDIRKMFEEAVGSALSAPEFELDGAKLSMKMHTVYSYKCESGNFSTAASSVQRYYGDKRGCGANCFGKGAVPLMENESEKPDVNVTDREPDGVCGDAITSFESDGRYYMIISDGMGSGKEAALTSGIVTSLLERLIKSGADLECALKMLNSIVRSADRECSATVDIAEIDLVTGEAKFVKSGAAPSFVLRDGSIFRLQSKTVPIGIIRALDAEMIKFDVQVGDTVVMLSDGVARSYDEVPWLLDLLVSDECILSGDEKCAAMTIVGEAAIRGATDDITAGIVRVKDNR